MIKAWRSVLEKVFAIREGELFRALAMQFNIFLIITTLLILKPTVNSLFLSAFGVESLPQAFILVAMAAGMVTLAYSRIIRKIKFKFLHIGTTVCTVICLLFFGFSLRFGFFGGWILYLFYIWVAIFALMATSQFWLLANMVFNDREIKRLVGFIGAGAIAGGVFGGYLTSFLARFISSVDLPFAGAFFMALCIPLNILIWKKAKPQQLPESRKTAKSKKESPLKIILKSRHLTLLACLVAVGSIVAKLVDYQFGGIASRLITNPEELTAFFGFWFSTFNVISLVIQLLITRFVVGRLGISVSLYMLPLAIGLAVLFLIAAPELLLSVILLKMADGSLKQSINKSSMELLFMPVNPNTKKVAKPFIDIFIDSVATGFSGLLLIFVIKGLSLSTLSINLIMIGFILIWMMLVKSVRKEYLQMFKMKILNNIQLQDNAKPARNTTVIGSVRRILEQGTDKQIVQTLKRITALKDKAIRKSVVKLLDHPSAEVRREALQHLHFYKNRELLLKVEKLTKDESDEVKLAALAYLIEHQPSRNLPMIEAQLEEKDDPISGQALVNLALQTQNNQKLQAKFRVIQKIQSQIEKSKHIKDLKKCYLNKLYCIQAIRYAGIKELYPALESFFEDSNPAVVRQALLTAGKIKAPYFVKKLILFRNKKAYARTATKALSGYGDKIAEHLWNIFTTTENDIQLLKALPKIFVQFADKRAVKFLFKMLDHEHPDVRQEVLAALNEIHRKHPKIRFRRKNLWLKVIDEVLRFQDQLLMLYVINKRKDLRDLRVIKARKRLINLLKQKQDANLKSIFRLLCLLYNRENITAVLKGMKSSKTALRITALEFLDNMLEQKLKKVLIPALEAGIVIPPDSTAIKKLNLPVPDEHAVLESILMNHSSLRLKLACLNYINALQEVSYLHLVEACTRFHDPELILFAKTILTGMKQQTNLAIKKRS